MRSHRAQAAVGGLALIPLITLIAFVVLSGLQAWGKVSRIYAGSLDRRIEMAAQRIEAVAENSTIILFNTGTMPVRLDKAIVSSDNSTLELSLNGTVLYPGENITINTGIPVDHAYIIAGNGGIIRIPAEETGREPGRPENKTLVASDNLVVDYMGPFYGGYTVRLGDRGWDLLNSKGLVYYPVNWSFDSDDVAEIALEPIVPTRGKHGLQAGYHYVFDHGILRIQESLEEGDYGGYKAYMGHHPFTISSGSPEEIIDLREAHGSYIPWYAEGAKIYARVLLKTPPTSPDLAFTVRVEDEGGLFAETYTGTRLTFWAVFDPRRGSEAICWDVVFSPDKLTPIQGPIHVYWRSGNYAYGSTRYYYQANYVLDVYVETTNVWVEYLGTNITMPLSTDNATRLPIYSANTSISLGIYYPAIASLESERASTNISTWSPTHIYVWSAENGSLAISHRDAVQYLEGSSITARPLQNAVARINVVQTISQLTIAGIPLGTRLSINSSTGGDTMVASEPQIHIQVRGPPITMLHAEIPLAAGITHDGALFQLGATLYAEMGGYLVVVDIPASPTIEEVYLLVPPGASPLTANVTRYVSYGSWSQITIHQPPPGTLELFFPQG